MIYVIKNDELYHHGIKNQRWGVRNGPPYPLDAKVSRRIKRRGQEKLRVSAKEYQAKRHKAKAYERSGTQKFQYKRDRELQEVVAASEVMNEFGEYKNVADILGDDKEHDFGLVTKKESIHDRVERIHSQNANLKNLDNYLFSGDLETLLSYTNINPGFKEENGTTNNCVKCTSALACNMMGYSGVAAGRSYQGALDSASTYYFDGAKQYKEWGDVNIYDRLTKGGRNSFGEIIGKYPNGAGGHSMFYFCNSNGELRVKDGQIDKTYNIDDPEGIGQFFDQYGFSKDDGAKITRLDNTTPNFEHMSEDSVLRAASSDVEVNQVKDRNTGERYSGY